MTREIEQETLVAYVDGELGEIETRQVEQLMAQDAVVRETVRQLRESALLLRAAFNEPVNAPVPAGLVDSINQAFATESRDVKEGRNGAARGPATWWPMALAACFFGLLIGGGLNVWLVDVRVAQEVARVEALNRANEQMKQAALFNALEQKVSGETVAWENPDSGYRGAITPVRTFKNRDEQWCREYTLRETAAGETEDLRRAIACREPAGQWRTRLVLISN